MRALSFLFILLTNILLANSVTIGQNYIGDFNEKTSIRTGPFAMLYEDGQLKYIRNNDKEIIRRIYFAVRKQNWDTYIPVETRTEASTNGDTVKVTIHQSYTCGNTGKFSAKITIAISANGTIKYEVSGNSSAPFKSPRIGICVLLGQEYGGKELTFDDQPISLPLNAGYPKLTKGFKKIELPEADISFSGSQFDIEDQRFFGDSSFKCYSGMYPKGAVPQNQTQKQAITITPKIPTQINFTPLEVSISPTPYKNKISNITFSDETTGKPFGYYLKNKDKANNINLTYNPTLHLRDNDTIIENSKVIPEYVKSLETTISHLEATLKNRYSPLDKEERLTSDFARIWGLSIIKEAVSCGITNITFPAESEQLIIPLKELEGKTLYQCTLKGCIPDYVFALATKDQLYLANRYSGKVAIIYQDKKIELDANRINIIDRDLLQP